MRKLFKKEKFNLQVREIFQITHTFRLSQLTFQKNQYHLR